MKNLILFFLTLMVSFNSFAFADQDQIDDYDQVMQEFEEKSIFLMKAAEFIATYALGKAVDLAWKMFTERNRDVGEEYRDEFKSIYARVQVRMRMLELERRRERERDRDWNHLDRRVEGVARAGVGV